MALSLLLIEHLGKSSLRECSTKTVHFGFRSHFENIVIASATCHLNFNLSSDWKAVLESWKPPEPSGLENNNGTDAENIYFENDEASPLRNYSIVLTW